MRINKLFCLLVLTGSITSIAKAEKGLPLYSMADRDLALVLNDQLQTNTDTSVPMKRMVFREVTAQIQVAEGSKSEERVVTATLFSVDRGTRSDVEKRSSTSVVAQNTLDTFKN